MRFSSSDVALVHRLADAAGTAILPHFRRLATVDNKAAEGFDPVTVADRNAEIAMRAVLAAERPDDAIHGEEFAPKGGTSGRTWVLDPIDGTRGFMAGLPTWGVLIALCDAEGPVLGMMSQPFVAERFLATPDGAVEIRNGLETALRTRRCKTLEAAVLATTSPDAFADADALAFRALGTACRMIRYGTDCYGYAMLAGGHIDVVVEFGLKAVDIAPFVPLIERAGGAVTDRSGAPIGPTLPHAFAGEAVAVGDARLLPAVLERLAR